MPQLSQVELEAMRQRMASAALDLYRRLGLEAVTLRALSTVLAISHTLPYRYFKNKDALLARMRRQCFEQLADAVLAADDPTADPVARLSRITAVYLDYAKRTPKDYRLMFTLENIDPEKDPELYAARTRLFEFGVNLVQQRLDQDGRAGDARTLMHLSWTGMHGLIMLHVGGHLVHGRTLEDLVRPLMQNLLGVSEFELIFNVPESPAKGKSAGRTSKKPALQEVQGA